MLHVLIIVLDVSFTSNGAALFPCFVSLLLNICVAVIDK